MIRALAVVGFALLGCSSGPASRRDPVANRGAVTVDAAVDGPGVCVEDCERERRMAAMSPEAIRAACVRDCATPSP